MELTWDELARFWSRVDVGEVDDCWPWRNGTIGRRGYGVIKFKGKSWRAHRVAFLLSGGRLTEAKPLVLHSCDTPGCCNPFHLRAGDDADNGADKASRNRVPRLNGETNPAARLTDAQVAEIRTRYTGRRGELSALAREYGCHRTNVLAIVRGRSRREQP